ncbi:transglycosylase domain-containing protein [Leptolyngbya sp. FACHB-261]|uniref:transglycosylase domain-containing protein n=1 Tax=Leptolyngbya sp. FACHB-261 TaxID=2692806 RepID=UPI0016887010|nr:PBP1A family penicillin-binding protein [Leptolyngbya sp. FACHB-261]MBD2102280.1 PBP1A family penicillin-binding protein [Leptolyngbya sp. FACHB-261]
MPSRRSQPSRSSRRPASGSERQNARNAGPPQDGQSPERRQARRKSLRNRRKLGPSKRPGPRHWLLLGATGLMTLTTGVAAFVWWQVNQNLPDFSNVRSFTRGGTLVIQAADGLPILQLGPTARRKAEINQIPKPLIDAFIATEDERFYQHGGIDYWGIVRAAFVNTLSGDLVQGGSTISQQLARMIFLDQERSLWRKLREAALAQALERKLDKQEVLELYLNQVYLGSGAYGVSDAAWIYFSKNLKDLSLAEAATLAGLAAAPSDYSPLVNPALAERRRNIVLGRMSDVGYISEDEAKSAQALPLDPKAGSIADAYSTAPYFASYIQQELPKYLTADQIEAGGLIVETSLNPKWQRAAEKAVYNAIDYDGPRFNFEQGALVAIDPKNGEIRALVGGGDFSQSQFNRVTQAQRQPGSTFKMFVYAAAMSKDWTPFDIYRDAPYSIYDYEPKNFGGGYRGDVSLVKAIANSINIVAVKLMVDVGIDPVINLARKMGIESPLGRDYSVALGSSEVNLMEITGAYATLANRGMHVAPHGIRRIIRARTGEVLYDSFPEAHRALDERTTNIITWMLQQVVQAGTGRPAQLTDRPAAGKTGTSEEGRDLWFIGFVPQLAAGVWLGNDDSAPTWGTSRAAAVTWQEFMADITEGIPVQEFPEPPQLKGRGLRPSEVDDERATSSGSSGGGSNRSNDEDHSSSDSDQDKAASEDGDAPSEPPASEAPATDSSAPADGATGEPAPLPPANEAPPENSPIQDFVPAPAPDAAPANP